MKTLKWLMAIILTTLCVTACRGQIQKEMNVAFGAMGGPELKLDVVGPAGEASTPRPALVLIHGGAWAAEDKSECKDMANMFARAGYVTFSVDYRLVTDKGNRWPAQLDDLQRAVRWVRAHAARFNIDPHRIGAIGGSAGGHLSACLGTTDTRDNSDPELATFSSRVNCVVNLAGPADLTEDFAPKVKQGAWTNEMVRNLLGQSHTALETSLTRLASPEHCVDSKSAPTLIFQGTKDEVVPVDQARRFDAALQKVGVESKLVLLDSGHGFDDAKSLAVFLTETTEFLKRHLRP